MKQHTEDKEAFFIPYMIKNVEQHTEDRPAVFHTIYERRKNMEQHIEEVRKVIQAVEEKKYNASKAIAILSNLKDNLSKDIWDKTAKEFFQYSLDNKTPLKEDIWDIFKFMVQTSSTAIQEFGINIGIQGLALTKDKDTNKTKDTKKIGLLESMDLLDLDYLDINTHSDTQEVYELLKLMDDDRKNRIIEHNIKPICLLMMQDAARNEDYVQDIFSKLSSESQKVLVDYIEENLNLIVPSDPFNDKLSFINEIFNILNEDVIIEETPKLKEIVKDCDSSFMTHNLAKTITEQIDFCNNKEELYETLANISVEDLTNRSKFRKS